MYDPAYESEDGWLTHRYELPTGNVLRYTAKDVRREHSGIHAYIRISMNWVSLVSSNFNVEKDEERVRLANSGYSHLDNEAHMLDRVEFPKNAFKHALDLFCEGLWDETVGQDLGGWLAGDPMVQPAHRLLESYILQDAGTIIYAPPGKGKSYTAIAMAQSLQHGVDNVWKLTDARTPLYMNLERSARSMEARLALVNRSLGLPADEGMYFLNARGRSLSDVYAAAKRTIAMYGCDVVFFDSISRGGAGTMNADDVANKIMDMLNALCPTWVALGHSPRGDDTHIFGSQMFDGACDLAVQLTAQTAGSGAATGIKLKVSKANDIPEGFSSTHVLEWDETGLAGIRSSRNGEFAELDIKKKLGVEEACMQSVAATDDHLIVASIVAEAYGLNRSNVAQYLSQSDRWVVIKRGGNNMAYYGLRSTREEGR